MERIPARRRSSFLVGGLFLVRAAIGQAQTADAGSRAEALAAAIGSLRVEARYADAVSVARELLDLRRSDAAARPHEIDDAERLVAAMQMAAALPESSRRELAEADRLEAEIAAADAAGDYATGAAKAERQLEIRTRLLGAEHPGLILNLDWRAWFLEARGQLTQAEPLYRDALTLARTLLGEEHPTVAVSLNHLAGVLRARGDLAGAEALVRQALAIDRKLLGQEDPALATSLNNLAVLLQDRGDYPGAESLQREALGILRRLHGDEDLEVAAMLNNLGTLLQIRGEYAEAEPVLRKALAIRRTKLEEAHPLVAASLNNLGALLHSRGDLAGAELLAREALALRRSSLGEDHPDVAESLNNVAVILKGRGQLGEAESLHREALAMRRRLFGEHPVVAASLLNLGEVLFAGGDYDGSELLYREALAMRRTLFPEGHVVVAQSLTHLALVLQRRGDYDSAEPLYEEALAICRKLLGEGHPYTAQSLGNLGLLQVARGDLHGAEPYLLQAVDAYEAARLRVGPGLWQATFQKSPHSWLAGVRLALGEEVAAWPSVEREVARVLADLLVAAGERGLTPRESAVADSLKRALGDAERRLAAFHREARADTTADAAVRVEEARNRLLEVEAAWSAFQKEMTGQHPVTEGQAYPLERVQHALGRRSAILGWLDVQWAEDDQESWGYVIRERGPVTWAKLKAPFDQAHSLRADLADRGSPAAGLSRDSESLYRSRMEPLLGALEGVEDILVIPSGPMSAVPVEALQDADGVALSDRFTITYIPSATIYTWLEERGADRTRDGPALLVGDPPFTESHRLAMDERQPEQVLLAVAEIPDTSAVRAALAGNEGVLDRLPRLPGTRSEVRALASLASGSTLLLGPDASEQEVVQLAESGQLASFETLHLATHALVDDEHPENCCLILSRVDLPDPLQTAMEGTRIYDGVITAKEILREWKLDADLVTLSACETALGKEIAGEGMVGFAHAFLQAGARSLLVSLWKVDDTATSLLMQRFYENWWRKDMPKAKALQEAKRWLREWEDDTGAAPYAHPYYWSAFILIGDPR